LELLVRLMHSGSAALSTSVLVLPLLVLLALVSTPSAALLGHQPLPWYASSAVLPGALSAATSWLLMVCAAACIPATATGVGMFCEHT
jgi:hypothetical protein